MQNVLTVKALPESRDVRNTSGELGPMAPFTG
jgi:hypothetical protein